jgi:23S rRNA (adenine2503-C2)-methyltransferase
LNAAFVCRPVRGERTGQTNLHDRSRAIAEISRCDPCRAAIFGGLRAGTRDLRTAKCAAVPDLINVCGLTCDELVSSARERLPTAHGIARKAWKQVMLSGRFDLEALGLADRTANAWREQYALTLPNVVRTVSEETDTGTTAKAVLATHDGLEYECVLLPMGRGRATLCISSQVGCKMGCRFCETGRMGLLRNLSAAEIVAELLVARFVLGWAFNNVVFMGMGEALDNADAVLQVLRVMTDPSGLGFSQERITICTVGRIDGIERLKTLGMKRLNLSISLNAGNDALRSELMPINRVVPLSRLQETLLGYRPRANFVLGVNYCLMPDKNDTREHAREVGAFCKPLGRVMVNVIPYNPGTMPLTRMPTEEEIDTFIGWLREEGLPVRRRITKGRSVMAACGQLGNVELRQLRRRSSSVTS